MGYQTRLKGAPIFGGYICGKLGIATFWFKSVVREKIVVSSPLGVLLMSPPTIYLKTTLTDTHTHDNVPRYYAIDNETIERRIMTTSAEPGFEPQVVSTWVNHITNMPIGMRHDWMAFDVVFIGACNLRKSARRKKNLCILQIFIND